MKKSFNKLPQAWVLVTTSPAENDLILLSFSVSLTEKENKDSG